MISIRLLCD